MNKPDIRITQQQVDTKPTDISINSAESYALLAKYGYKTSTEGANPQIINPNQELTFEEMVRREEEIIKSNKEKIALQKELDRNKPNTYSFDNRNIAYQNTSYKSIGDNFGIQVQIVSDMPIDRRHT